MYREHPFETDGFYHLYSRGANKNNIFLQDEDYKRFIFLLFISNNTEKNIRLGRIFQDKSPKNFEEILEKIQVKDTLVDIGAYCLMPNHFHILIKVKDNEKGVSVFMQRLLTGYSMYFNTKYQRTGVLFESRFKSKFVMEDNYLKYLYSYIHLNPISIKDKDWKEKGIKNKLKMKSFLNKYQYSSFLDYVGSDRLEKEILNRGVFPEYFETNIEFEDFINDWLDIKSDKSLF